MSLSLVCNTRRTAAPVPGSLGSKPYGPVQFCGVADLLQADFALVTGQGRTLRHAVPQGLPGVGGDDLLDDFAHARRAVHQPLGTHAIAPGRALP